MKRDDLERLYDEAYAVSYDAKFLDSEIAIEDTRFELEVIGSHLAPGTRWLDAGCGTGYYLSRFPGVERAGLDLSRAMLDRARSGNPGAELRCHDFREPIPEWTGRFGLVTCMWYAYAYVDTAVEVAQVIANLAAWTATGGHCFVPLADPRRVARCDLPDRIETGWGGPVTITGILWTWSDEAGTKLHRDLVCPHMSWMRDQFARWFASVEIFEYPSEAYGRRPGLIATAKRT